MFDFRHPYQPGLIGKNGASEQEFLEIQRKSEIALSTLQSIFPNHVATDAAYLRGDWGGSSNCTFEELHESLKTLAKTLKWPDGARDGRWNSAADDPIECHDMVGKFMQEGLWPLTNIVRYAS